MPIFLGNPLPTRVHTRPRADVRRARRGGGACDTTNTVVGSSAVRSGIVEGSSTPMYFLAEDVFRDRKLNIVAMPGAGLMRNTDEKSKEGTDDVTNHSSFEVSLFGRKLRAGLRPKLMYLVPTNGNPRGGTLPFGKSKKLIKLGRENIILHRSGRGVPPFELGARRGRAAVQVRRGGADRGEGGK